MTHAATLAAQVIAATLAAQVIAAEPSIPLVATGGDALTIRADADQQKWAIIGPTAILAATRNGELHLVTVPLPATDPPPPSPPDPQPPDPKPSPPRLLIMIEETEDRTPTLAAALADPEIRAALAAANCHLRIADVDITDETGQPPADLAPYIAAARRAGLPRLFAIDAAGAEIYAGAAPTDTARFRDLLARLGIPQTFSPPRRSTPDVEGRETAPACNPGQCRTTWRRR